VADISESLAFQRVSWESRDEDIADVFNQLNRDLSLDELIRKLWRELCTYSQVVVAMWCATRVPGPRGHRHRPQAQEGVHPHRPGGHDHPGPDQDRPGRLHPLGAEQLRSTLWSLWMSRRGRGGARGRRRPLVMVVWVDVHASDQAPPFLRSFTAWVGLPLVHAPAPEATDDLRGPAGCMFVRG
jgi:hypothetical protein